MNPIKLSNLVYQSLQISVYKNKKRKCQTLGGKNLIHSDPSRVDELAAIKRIIARSWDGLIIIPATLSPFYPSLSSSRLIGQISRLCTLSQSRSITLSRLIHTSSRRILALIAFITGVVSKSVGDVSPVYRDAHGRIIWDARGKTSSRISTE